MPKRSYNKLKKWTTTKTKVPVFQTFKKEPVPIHVHECLYRTAAKGKMLRGTVIVKNGEVFGVLSDKLQPVAPETLKVLALIAIG